MRLTPLVRLVPLLVVLPLFGLGLGDPPAHADGPASTASPAPSAATSPTATPTTSPTATPTTSPTASPSATPTATTLSGSLLGQDGRAVDALLGFDWLDGRGHRIDRNGCVQSASCPLPGYATVLRVNPGLPADGTSATATATTDWSVPVPPGAAQLFLEAYPQNAQHRTDELRYGHSMRHAVPLPQPGPLSLVLPLVDCGQGGSTGSVTGTATRDGAPAPLARAVAWSLEAYDPVARPILGWNIGTGSQDGTFRVPNLVGDARYQVWVTASDGTVRKTFGVAVPRCGSVSLPLDFSAQAAQPPLPEPSLSSTQVTFGGSVQLQGAAGPGALVEVLAATGDGAPAVVRSGTASPSGYWAFEVSPTLTTALSYRTGGQTSPAVTVAVAPHVRLSLRRTAPRTYAVTVASHPARAQVVDLVMPTASGRRLLSRATTGGDGTVVFPRRFLTTGTLRVYAVTHPDDSAAEGRSNIVTLRVF